MGMWYERDSLRGGTQFRFRAEQLSTNHISDVSLRAAPMPRPAVGQRLWALCSLWTPTLLFNRVLETKLYPSYTHHQVTPLLTFR